MGPIIFTLSLLILVMVWNPFDTDKKGNNLANRMRVLSRKSVKLKQDNERAFYKAHIKEWTKTPFYQFVFDTIKKVAEKGENGVVINYYFGKSDLPPIKPHYIEAVTSSGHKTLYACYAYYFSKDEKDNILQDYASHESYFYGLEKYLKEEGFYIKDLINNDSITISW